MALMKIRKTAACAAALSWLGVAVLSTSGARAEGEEKWYVCHNGNTIEVATPAVLNAHLDHGDAMGTCEGAEGGSEGGEQPTV